MQDVLPRQPQQVPLPPLATPMLRRLQLIFPFLLFSGLRYAGHAICVRPIHMPGKKHTRV